MPMLAQLRDEILEGQAEDFMHDLLDDPDCLAEQPFTYSVFRLRYSWGTVYEVSFTSLADAHDRSACWALLPPRHVLIDTQESDTMGVGYNGVTSEITHRVIGTYDLS